MSIAQRLIDLQQRLTILRERRTVELDLFERARALFLRDDGVVDLSELKALDADLERAGVHTSSDARLLKQLGQVRGKVGMLAKGLSLRATKSLEQFEAAILEMERLHLSRSLTAELRVQIEQDFVKLLRIVKVATIFETPEMKGFERFARVERKESTAPHSAKVATAEYLFSRGLENSTDVAKQRGDFQRAKEVLLLLGSAQAQDKNRVRALKLELGSLKSQDVMGAAPRSLHRLVRHLRGNLKSNPKETYRALRETYQRAVRANDDELARVASQGLEMMLGQTSVTQSVERDAAKRLFSVGAQRVEPAAALKSSKTSSDSVAEQLTQLAFSLDENTEQALALASGCAHYFDVEESLSHEMTEAPECATKPVMRTVPYPTQNLVFDYATHLDDLHNFVVTHPQMLVLDLASGRQLKRSYLEEEKQEKPKAIKKTAVRVYVLDASGSMYGERSKFRDAILIAELNSIRVRAQSGVPFDPLYFCFFNDFTPDLVRVDSGALATSHIESLMKSSPASGQTDITYAAFSAIDSIQKAQGVDPYLAKATVVLITDGEDSVELPLITEKLSSLGDLRVSLSFISLGEENPDLKNLVLGQREKGKRAFYHHLSDNEIALIPSEFDSAFRTLIPMDLELTGPIAEQLAPHLDALEAIANSRVVKPIESNEAQFDTLFPSICNAKGKLDVKLVERIADILEAVADTASLAPMEQRAHESVSLLIHLFGVYALNVSVYLGCLNPNAKTLVALVDRIRLLCKFA